MKNPLAPYIGVRREADWRAILTELTASLSKFIGVALEPVSWYTGDDDPGCASSNCVNVRGTVNQAFALDACGVVCISCNFGATPHASADLLLFSGGRRILGPGGADILFFNYHKSGWTAGDWRFGECGEWDSHDTDARWRTSPGQSR